MMLLAELVIRHTRRHMPTRRVALEHAYLPTTGPAPGIALLGAVVDAHLPRMAPEQIELLPRVLAEARHGLSIPRIALRHRLQNDRHGLDRSRHRVFGEDGYLVVEIDVHGAPTPQVLGAVLAAAELPSAGRGVALATIAAVIDGRWRGLARDVVVRRIAEGITAPPPLAGTESRRPGGPSAETVWLGIDADQRWAMEVLGLGAGMVVLRDDVNQRFRRLLRAAHPDHGGATARAAARIEELTQAREILLDLAADAIAAEG